MKRAISSDLYSTEEMSSEAAKLSSFEINHSGSVLQNILLTSSSLTNDSLLESFLSYALTSPEGFQNPENIPVFVKHLTEQGQFEASTAYLEVHPVSNVGMLYALMYSISHQNNVSEEHKGLYLAKCDQFVHGVTKDQK